MKPETFLDTSAFYALLVKADDQHERMAQWMTQAERARVFCDDRLRARCVRHVVESTRP